MIQLIICIKYRTTSFNKEKKQKINIALFNRYELGVIKNFSLRNSLTSMQRSWVKILFEDDFYDWKVIPLLLIGKHLRQNFKFHNNVGIDNDVLSKFPSFYQDIFIK